MTCFRLSNGQTLAQYCKENNFPYSTLFAYIDRDGLSPDDAISRYQKWNADGTITNHRRGKQRLYYKGQQLKKYCTERNLAYPTIIAKLRLGYPIEEVIHKYYKRGFKPQLLNGETQ